MVNLRALCSYVATVVRIGSPRPNGSCEKIRPVGHRASNSARNSLRIIGGGVPSRRVCHKFRIFSRPHAGEGDQLQLGFSSHGEFRVNIFWNSQIVAGTSIFGESEGVAAAMTRLRASIKHLETTSVTVSAKE